MTRKETDPPVRARRALKSCASEDTIYNANEGNNPRRQFQAPLARIPAAEIVSDLAFRRQVERVHSLGPRVSAERRPRR